MGFTRKYMWIVVLRCNNQYFAETNMRHAKDVT